MILVLKRSLKPIKNGWSAESPNLGVAAHGRSPELADENLIHTARLFFAPAQREGRAETVAAALGLKFEGGDAEGLTIRLEE